MNENAIIIKCSLVLQDSFFIKLRNCDHSKSESSGYVWFMSWFYHLKVTTHGSKAELKKVLTLSTNKFNNVWTQWFESDLHLNVGLTIWHGVA